MEQCKDCLREAAFGCEAYKIHQQDCWAKETNKGKYIKEQYEIIAYNKAHHCTAGYQQALKSIRRVTKGAVMGG